MKLYLLSQSVNNGYDTYSDVVVAAENEYAASIINPGGFYKWHDDAWFFQYYDEREEKMQFDDTWCPPSDVEVEYIGEAADGIKEGVICSSFHAG